MEKANGFTLLELMITLAIVVILATTAVPSFWQTIQNNRATTQANELTTAINTARSEASKRGQRVRVCPSRDGATCDNGNDWTIGWIVLRDDNDEVIRVWDALPPTANLTGNGHVVYRPVGDVLAARAFDLFFDGCQGEQRRTIQVNAAGRPNTTRQACP